MTDTDSTDNVDSTNSIDITDSMEVEGISDFVVGIDAGGSKTRVVVATLAGEQLAEVVGPPAAMSPGNAEHSAAVIAALVASALANAEVGDRLPRALCAGVAGTGRETEQRDLQDALTRRAVADAVMVETDAQVALSDAFGDGAGIILIAGTGSIAFGRSPAGAIARCGGWGLAFGDEGSGAWIGRRALSVVAAAHDGREPETALTGAILTAAQVNQPEQLIPWAIAADKQALGALAPSVVAMAMQDDIRANSIIDMAVEELVLHVRALGKRLFVDDRAAFDVAFTGGLLRKGSLLRKRLERRLKTAVPGATVNAVEIDAARGAVKLALRCASISRAAL
ncbi:MAG: BadF/BadG/BcrA/BcrD ATPase family protein [Gemmatimonadaceae bacterium]